MADINFRKADASRAFVGEFAAGEHHGPFATLKIATGTDTVTLFLAPERADWARNVAAAINAPAMAQVEQVAA